MNEPFDAKKVPNSVEGLVQILNFIKGHPMLEAILTEDMFLTVSDAQLDENHELVAAFYKLQELADTNLITDKGLPNYDTIKILKKDRYNVFAGEKDGFGWLTGIISCAKFKFIFG